MNNLEKLSEEGIALLCGAIVQQAYFDYIDFGFDFYKKGGRVSADCARNFIDALEFLQDKNALAIFTEIEGGVLLSKARATLKEKLEKAGADTTVERIEFQVYSCPMIMIDKERQKIKDLKEEIEESEKVIKNIKEEEIKPLQKEIKSWKDQQKQCRERIAKYQEANKRR